MTGSRPILLPASCDAGNNLYCCQGLGYDHVVLLLALIKLDYNLTSTSWPSSSGLRGRRGTYLTILKRAWSAHSKMVSPPATSEARARVPRRGR
jgi:hypothetical protein